MDERTKELAQLYSRRRLLMVDDDVDFVETFKTLAAGSPCEFTYSSSFDAAIKEIERIENFDSIWIDLGLNKGHTGEEVLQIVKARDRTKPVVIFSAHIDIQRMEAISKIGVAFYLPKPAFLNPSFFNEVFGFMSKVRV